MAAPYFWPCATTIYSTVGRVVKKRKNEKNVYIKIFIPVFSADREHMAGIFHDWEVKFFVTYIRTKNI